jgi:flagellar basal-body rod protein FlgG
MRALYSAASGMTAQQHRLDTIANNISNVSTTGFKKSRDAFQDLFYQTLATGGVQSNALQLGNGVRLAGVERDHGQGTLVATNDPLHVALQGDGFFVVETLEGERLYTRDGQFTQDVDGMMVTQSGLRVAGDIQIPTGAASIRVDYDGTVHAAMPDGQDAVVGQLELARFVNPAGLMAQGGNLYRQSPTSGDPTDVQPGTDVQVVQGFLEQSNVDVAGELIDMIQAQRVFELNSKVVQAADESLQIAVNLRR